MFSAPDHNCHDEVSKESNWLSFGISRLPSNLFDLLVGFQRLQGRLWQCLKIIWDWSKIHLMHMLFYDPSRLLLTESPTVGVFLILFGSHIHSCRAYFGPLIGCFCFCCACLCLVASLLFQKHVAFQFRLDGSGFQLFYIRFALDVIRLGACEPRVKDHYICQADPSCLYAADNYYPKIVAWTRARFLQVYL